MTFRKYVKFMLWAVGLRPLVGWYGDDENNSKKELTGSKNMGDSGMSKSTAPTGLLGKLSSVSAHRPEGWHTLEELLEKDPMPKSTARDLLNKAIKAGTVEVKKFKSPIPGGRFAIRLNYKEKP